MAPDCAAVPLGTSTRTVPSTDVTPYCAVTVEHATMERVSVVLDSRVPPAASYSAPVPHIAWLVFSFNYVSANYHCILSSFVAFYIALTYYRFDFLSENSLALLISFKIGYSN